MPAFTPSLSASQVDARLRAALTELRAAEENAVLWFSDVVSRKLYRELGYASIHQYAMEALGFSRSRTFQFVRLAERLQELPHLRASVADGSVPWTKAREVAKVATPDSERQWVEEAKTHSRRELEQKIETTRARAKAARRRRACPEQGELLDEESPASDAPSVPAGDPPVEVSFRFAAEEYARFEGLMERLRKSGVREKREEVLLAALETMVAERTAAERTSNEAQADAPATGPDASSQHIAGPKVTRVSAARSPYHVLVMVCPRCGKGDLNTSQGLKPVSPALLRAMACDADVECNGKNRAAVPPRLRRAVLARDHHRCRMAGCGSTRFLHVHHAVLRENGGPNTLDNLLVVCSRCHVHLHEMEERHRARETA